MGELLSIGGVVANWGGEVVVRQPPASPPANDKNGGEGGCSIGGCFFGLFGGVVVQGARGGRCCSIV